LTAGHALSQPLIETQRDLDFGTQAVAANTLVSQLIFPQSGNNITITGQFVLIANGTTGRYRFTGFPASTELDINLTNTTLSTAIPGVSEQLTVDNYSFSIPTTNAQGEADMSLGARLTTSGNGAPYADAPYTGTTVLSVRYWQPLVNSFVTNTRIIDITTELRSSLTINEEQALHFGTLVARSSNSDQAVLSLSPTGSYSISEPGNSRLVSLSNPDQGVLRVSGAAPNYSLTVSPQAADILLEHTESPNSAPHFILSALLTSCLLYTSPSPRDRTRSRMPSSA